MKPMLFVPRSRRPVKGFEVINMSETSGVGAAELDTSYHQRRLAQRLEDPTFRAEYERARTEIRQVDEVMRTLDSLRESAGITKAEMARRIGKDPASVRRLFSSESNPELKTIVAMAAALNAKIQISVPSTTRRPRRRRAPREVDQTVSA
jgi:DNA-binding XRE family transcriptional regulator